MICFSESADHLVGGNGKFEEIIACSQEIAAATAQLVAASNVRKYWWKIFLEIFSFLWLG